MEGDWWLTTRLSSRQRRTSRECAPAAASSIGALGGLGAWAAASIARPGLARGGTDGDVVLGAENISSEPTTIREDDNPFGVRVTFLEPRPDVPTERIALYADAGNDADGIGVQAIGGSLGYGVDASTLDGIALRGRASRGGLALQTAGKVRLGGHAGFAVIPAGRTSVTITTEVGSTSTATLSPMVNLGGRTFWYTKDSRKNTLTIRISSARSTPTRFSWHMLD